MTVEPKAQSSTRFLSRAKTIEEDIDLDEEIVIPKWDLTNILVDQMQTIGELLLKKAKQEKLKEERDKEYRIIEDANNILSKAKGVEIDSSQQILLQLAKAV